MDRNPSALTLKGFLVKLQSINDRCNKTISQYSAHAENLDPTPDTHSNLLRSTLTNTSDLISFELNSLESKLTTISKRFLTFEESIQKKTDLLTSAEQNFSNLEKAHKTLSKNYRQ